MQGILFYGGPNLRFQSAIIVGVSGRHACCNAELLEESLQLTGGPTAAMTRDGCPRVMTQCLNTKSTQKQSLI